MNKKVIIIATLIFIATFVAYICIVNYLYPGLLVETRFQDYFAAITALFSGLAFLGIVCAILLQREELSLQRKELELTRKELKRTAKAQEQSQDALSRQAASLRATAKLNGLSSMLQYKSSLIEAIAIGKYGNSGIAPDLKMDADNIVSQIQNIIGEK